MPCRFTDLGGGVVVVACSRRSAPSRMVAVEYELVLRRTAKAVLLRGKDASGRTAEDWWPVSQCPDLESGEADAHAVGDGPDVFEAPEWLVREKGWPAT